MTSQRETIWCLNPSLKKRTTLESFTLSDHPHKRMCSSLAEVTSQICASTIFLYLDVTLKSNLKTASSCLRIIQANLARLYVSSSALHFFLISTKLFKLAAQSSISVSNRTSEVKDRQAGSTHKQIASRFRIVIKLLRLRELKAVFRSFSHALNLSLQMLKSKVSVQDFHHSWLKEVNNQIWTRCCLEILSSSQLQPLLPHKPIILLSKWWLSRLPKLFSSRQNSQKRIKIPTKMKVLLLTRNDLYRLQLNFLRQIISIPTN